MNSLNSLMSLVAQESVNSIAGASGWAGAGLLGAVLAWLMFIHLPAVSKQFTLLLEMQAKERETERNSRHAARDLFNVTLLKIQADGAQAMRELQTQHRSDANSDREAFLQRNVRIEDAIRAQTVELKAALAMSCRYYQPQPVPGKPSPAG
jgi:hypothetical protein